MSFFASVRIGGVLEIGQKHSRCGMGLVFGAAAALGVSARTSMGNITLVETPVAINSTLAADGWIGIKLTLVADAASKVITAMDFKNNEVIELGSGKTELMFTPTEVEGIAGPVHQAWTVTGSTTTPTPSGVLNTSGTATDSSFLNTDLYLPPPDPFTENNNLAAGGDGSSFAVSPLTDTGTVKYGVGSLMTYSGGVPIQQAVASMDIAFVIVPAGTGNVTLRGVGLDPAGDEYVFDQVLNPAGFGGVGGGSSSALTVLPTLTGFLPGTPLPAPEPGSLMVLGSVAVILMKRRSRK